MEIFSPSTAADLKYTSVHIFHNTNMDCLDCPYYVSVNCKVKMHQKQNTSSEAMKQVDEYD